LALRHQLLVLNQKVEKPKPGNGDRLLWICLRAIWAGWEKATEITKPQTMIGWHRAGLSSREYQTTVILAFSPGHK